MAHNKQLADERGISLENRQYIDQLHDLLEKLIDSYTLEIPYDEAKELVHSAEFTLQSLWGFPQDERYHTRIDKLNQKWMNLKWAGRTFQCKETGKEVMLTYNKVYEKSFVQVGEGFVDLGVAGGYYRMSGVEEIL